MWILAGRSHQNYAAVLTNWNILSNILDIVKEFNELHKGEIVVEPIYTGSYTDTMQKLLAAMVGGDLPAIAQTEQSRVGQFIESEAIQCLEDFIAKDPEF